MRLKALLFTGVIAFASTVAMAQSWVVDSVEMGSGYANDVFYSLKNGAAGTASNTNWHIAFQTTPQGPYGHVSIFANHTHGVDVYSLHLGAAANFATLSAADTIGKTGSAHQLFNSDSSWNFGALNKMNNPANAFDYSWGFYDQQTHKVVGDSLYLLMINDGTTTTAYKLWVKEYVSTPIDSIHWLFRIANFDGSEDTTLKIYRSPNFTDRLFAYYDVVNQTVLDREPSRSAWDILFTRYKEYIPGAPGSPYYSVTGVLSNFDVTVAEKVNMGPDDTVGFVSYPYSDIIGTIGSDWKTFNMTTFQYELEDSTYYFIKTKNTNEYYQLQFTGFNSANGRIIFGKRYLGAYNPLNVTDLNQALVAYKLVPNPAGNNVNVLVDSKEKMDNTMLIVTDISGRIAFRSSVNVKSGLNAYSINTSGLASGTYVVNLTNGSWKATEKLVVQQ